MIGFHIIMMYFNISYFVPVQFLYSLYSYSINLITKCTQNVFRITAIISILIVIHLVKYNNKIETVIKQIYLKKMGKNFHLLFCYVSITQYFFIMLVLYISRGTNYNSSYGVLNLFKHCNNYSYILHV